jgi:hypothetical protein
MIRRRAEQENRTPKIPRGSLAMSKRLTLIFPRYRSGSFKFAISAHRLRRRRCAVFHSATIRL